MLADALSAAAMSSRDFAVALDPQQLRVVRDVIARVLPGAEVWIFGSRATGKARPFSDLDLLLTKPSQLNWSQRAALRDEFEASDLPFCVDVVESAELPVGLAQRIAGESIFLDLA